jgi:AraC family transcriptional regulator
MTEHLPADSPIGPALRYIDQHLDEPVSLAVLAEACGLSPFHFARLFTALIGSSPVAYARRARLVMAARRLVRRPAPRLIDLALDSGFESQEAFTRAFVRSFGVPPGRFRRAFATLNEREYQTMNETTIDLDATLEASPEPVQHEGFRVVGLSGTYDSENRHEIPHLWDRLVPHLPVPGQSGREAYGICWSKGPEVPFRYMAAVAVAADAPVPDGLEAFAIPEQTYLVFRQKVTAGPFHPQVAAAMGEIWGRRLPASGHRPSGGPDFERYPADLVPGVTDGTMEYYIPVEG